MSTLLCISLRDIYVWTISMYKYHFLFLTKPQNYLILNILASNTRGKPIVEIKSIIAHWVNIQPECCVMNDNFDHFLDCLWYIIKYFTVNMQTHLEYNTYVASWFKLLNYYFCKLPEHKQPFLFKCNFYHFCFPLFTFLYFYALK